MQGFLAPSFVLKTFFGDFFKVIIWSALFDFVDKISALEIRISCESLL